MISEGVAFVAGLCLIDSLIAWFGGGGDGAGRGWINFGGGGWDLREGL